MILRVFGDLSVLDGDRVCSRFATDRARELLAFLALSHGQPVARERLIEALWPGEDPASCRNRLSVTLSLVRTALRRAGLDPDDVLLADRRTLALADGVENEWGEFWRLIERSAGVKESEREAVLTRAMELHRGPLCAGLETLWVQQARHSALAAFAGATASLHDWYQARQDWARAQSVQEAAERIARLVGQGGVGAED